MIFSKYFNPKINKGIYSNRSIISNSELPIKSERSKNQTKIWLEKEKRKLRKEIEKSVSAYRGKKPVVKSADIKKIKSRFNSHKKLLGKIYQYT